MGDFLLVTYLSNVGDQGWEGTQMTVQLHVDPEQNRKQALLLH